MTSKSSFDAPTLFTAFSIAASACPDNAFLVVPASAERDYLQAGVELTYEQVRVEVDRLIALYEEAGIGIGHRVALMLDNRPEHILHFLALNAVGATISPINPDYMKHEITYLLDHSKVVLAVALPKHRDRIAEAAAEADHPVPVVLSNDLPGRLPRAPTPRRPGEPDRDTEVAILYTSGTTGRPKGCRLDNEYVVACGTWYTNIGGLLSLRTGTERLYNPLPLFHLNNGILCLAAMIHMRGALIVPDRFHPRSFWSDLVETRATIMHYLGIMPPLLIKADPVPDDHCHSVRVGAGAGIDPQLHAAFEARFGFPLVELWGMTEVPHLIADAAEPRNVSTRAFGRAAGGLEARVVDDQDRDVPDNEPGEMLVRMAGADPAKGLFRGYLDDPRATEEAWRGGWFHTGDVVTRDASGMLYFVERRKNIIRRSGENISAAEVENALIALPEVDKVAVLALPDELRDEEVCAAIVVARGVSQDQQTAERIQDALRSSLAYHKLPGWVAFIDDLPTTSTQKVRKGLIFPAGVDPKDYARSFDLRGRKTRRHT